MARPTIITITTLALTMTSAACIDTASLAIKSTAKVLKRAQPSLKMEADYDMARMAIPGALKTVEGFHVAQPDNPTLIGILAEGYCQYATGFVEDEWEVALFAKDFDGADYQAERATKFYTRCMNYGLRMVPKSWTKQLSAPLDDFAAVVGKTGHKYREGMLWVAYGLASTIKLNSDNIDVVSYLPKARVILERIVALDAKHPPKDKAKAALPHLALGLLETSLPKALGGKPEIGKAHFEKAIAITEGKYLIAKVYMAKSYGRATLNRELFHTILVEVLNTNPAIWPQQRLANEIAGRRARRYLKMEEKWF